MSWHPVAGMVDVPFRHVAHAELRGRELAVWRADDGYVNVWDNRCVHRGVRLSIGVNDGHELRCRYHAWRYANRTGGCTYIPAHPGDAPGPSLCVRTFPCHERYGMIWTTLDDDGVGDGPISVGELEGDDVLALRGVPVDASAEAVLEALRSHRFQPSASLRGDTAAVRVVSAGAWSAVLRAEDAGDVTTAVFFVQPVDDEHAIVRGAVAGVHDEVRLAVLRHHDARLTTLAERVEAARRPARPWAHVPAALAPVEAPAPPPAGAIPVAVRRKWSAGEGVAGFELAPVSGALPTAQPGAHIDVHLPNGLVRQYSLVNGPGEQDCYRIGVKREAASTGGSVALHESVAEGAVLHVSAPRANFPLRRDALRTVLLAGGIGATPLLSMAQALAVGGPPFELHLFVQSHEHVPFPEIVGLLGPAVTLHVGLTPEETGAAIERVLGPFQPLAQLYVCGPGPMIGRTCDLAAALGWPEDAVHFEYFKNTRDVDLTSSFEVELARSGLSVPVPPGRSILEVVREHGVHVDSSCEQGACGSCLVTVLDGTPDHQDVYLRPSEHAAGDRMMVCVSRSLSPRLVLDL